MLTLGFALIFLVVGAIQRTAYLRGFARGVVLTAYVGVLVLMFLMTTEGVQQLAGAWGEDNTRDQLKVARKRKCIWGSVDNIEVSGVDIDHLVLTPAGAFALESKWHFRELTRNMLDSDVQQARARARTAASVLRSKHIDEPMDVTPVVVVWGRAQREIPEEGVHYDGVDVVAGADLPQWLERKAVGRLAEDNAATMLRRLETFASARRAKGTLPEPRAVGAGLRL